MKKTYYTSLVTIILFALMVVPCAQGFEPVKEKTVGAYATTSQFTEKEMTAIKATPKKIASMERKLFGDKKNPGALATIKAAADAAQASAADAATKAEGAATAVASLTTAVENHTKAIKSNTSMATSIKATLDAFREEVRNDFLLFGIIIGVVVLFFAWLTWFAYSRIRKLISEQTLKLVRVANDVFEEVKKTPAETAKKVHEYFDPKPFEFDIDGKHITYAFPTDDHCYRTLKVEDAGDGNPENFERQVVSSGYSAKNYSKGTMKKFFRGSIAGTNEEKLINYLWKVKKEIIIS